MTSHVDRFRLARFFKKVTPLHSGCWLWTGYANPRNGGYGMFWWAEKRLNTSAHRVAFAWFVRPVERSEAVDHLCRNRLCVNPAHLEAVTPAENARRALVGRTQRFCKRGHPMTPDNIFLQRNYDRTFRTCWICRRLREARRCEKRRRIREARLMSNWSDATRPGRKDPITHWAPWDSVITNGIVRTPCGQRIEESKLVGLPTCPTCKAACEAYNALNV